MKMTGARTCDGYILIVVAVVLGLPGTVCQDPVHGQWGEWNPWYYGGRCETETCGSNVRDFRFRSCDNPKPANGGDDCKAGPDGVSSLESVVCDFDPCPKYGRWEPWGYWGTCFDDQDYATCGEFYRQRTRECYMSKQANAYCEGGEAASVDRVHCSHIPYCPVDGKWGQWSEWSECDLTCGRSSKRTRMRYCDNPAPQHGGFRCDTDYLHDPADYLLEETQTLRCDVPRTCAIPGNWSPWSEWAECSATCGDHPVSRSRACDNPPPADGGADCYGDSMESQLVSCGPQCQIDGGWSDWTQWSECSQTCGDEWRTRSRACDNPAPQFGGAECPGDDSDALSCGLESCSVDGNWSPWSEWSECSGTCGGGTHSHTRTCTNPPPAFGGNDCEGDAEQYGECNSSPCPIDGQWSAWGEWTACTRTCGGGSRTRSRSCSDPPPAFGGVDCDGDSSETDTTCGDAWCRIDGKWSKWTQWSECTVTCSFGYQTRNRNCSEPAPAFGGRNCPGFGIYENWVQEESCMGELMYCPVDGNFTEWTPWPDCPVPCGGATIMRNRSCTNPAPMHGGRDCEGNTTEIMDCNTMPCGVNGGFSPWSNFSDCSVTCGGGTKFRTRTCTNPAPTYGGRPCKGKTVQSRSCNNFQCEDGQWTEWSPWSICTASCKPGGVQARTRSCTNPPPLPPFGRDCPADDPYSEWRHCNQQPCPVHGKWGGWSPWSDCPVTCGGAFQEMHRNCSHPPAQWGGIPCRGKGVRMKKCNTDYCPMYGVPQNISASSSDTSIFIEWAVPLEFEWPIERYIAYYRVSIPNEDDPAILFEQAHHTEYPYDIYNLSHFEPFPTKDNETFKLEVWTLRAYTDYDILLTSQHGYWKVSNHSELIVIKTERHLYPAPPMTVNFELADYFKEREYKAVITWSRSDLGQFSDATKYYLMIKDIMSDYKAPWISIANVTQEITGYLLRQSKMVNLKDNMYMIKVVASNKYGDSSPAVCTELIDYNSYGGVVLFQKKSSAVTLAVSSTLIAFVSLISYLVFAS
ncbi:SCO-spondin-like [Ptychodera flava]|uniref:SCO-spondin-like n=1 Tax=Ptychodera flava TaxID=63121 RepID=UPI003969FEED